MKFQIVTYNQAKRRLGYPPASTKSYLATMTGPLPETLDDPFRAEGATPEEAKTKLIAMVQRFLDDYPELEFCEVNLEVSE